MSDTQRDREERQHVIEVLKSWDGYFIGYTSDEVQEALRYAIASIKTDLRYDLLYEETSEQADKPTTKNDLSSGLEKNSKKLENPTTKNNLGVDWESYKDLDGNSLDDLILEVLQNNFDCGNTYGYKVADEIIGLLPSVTPIRPKGYWIETAEDYYKAINEKGGGVNENTDYFTDDIACSECLAKFSVIDNEADRFDFCPCCGSDNREVEE